jgi:prepilin-type N-terminal cleavage/methylation domain-containing protein
MTEQKPHQKLSQSRDGGYTIIESLVAMIVVSVLMIAIAPVMAFSVATRVQARRTEMATQAGRAYIDALRTGALKFGLSGFPVSVTAGNLADVAPPPDTSTLYCVDMDENLNCQVNSSKDFYVQGAWQNLDPTITGGNPTSKGYQLLVRVYRADSFAPDAPGRIPPRNAKQSIVGSGLGDRRIPVVEMSTEIPALGTPSLHKSLCNRLKTGTAVCP